MPRPALPTATLVASSLLLAAGATTAIAQCIVEEAYDPPSFTNVHNADNTAQSFTPIRSFRLDAVELGLSAGTEGWAVMAIQDAPVSPGIIYESAQTQVTASGFVRFDVRDVPVMAGVTYYITLSVQYANIRWRWGEADPYPRGRAYVNGNPQNYNFLFRTCSPNETYCVVHEAYDPPVWTGNINTSQGVLAQSFTSAQSFTIDGVELLLDTLTPTTVTAYLQDGPTDSPGLIHAIGYASFSGPGFIYFDLAPVPIVPGTTYYLRIDGAARWFYGEQFLYEGGQAFINNIVWVNDFIFRTCSEPVPVEPETWGAIKMRYRSP